MDETIAGWSPADLRRYVVNTILTDPGAFPKQPKDDTPKVTVSATPPSAKNGDIWIYTGNGFDWSFIFDSSDATYPWRFIGGGPASAWDNTQIGTAGTNMWQTPPTLTVPREGHYFVTWSAEAFAATIHATGQVEWNMYIGNGSTTYQYSRFHFNADTTAGNFEWGAHFGGQGDYGVLTAGTVLQIMASPAAGWDLVCDQRAISLTPIRIR